MSTYTINDDQVRDFHNALCDLKDFKERMGETLSQDTLKQLLRGISAFDKAFKPVRAEADKRWNLKHTHYDKIREMNNLTSVWSMYDVDNIFDNSDLFADTLVYKDHWGKESVTVALPKRNLQYWDLWKAAEEAIINSTDTHHIYIEKFVKKGDELFLVTGS